MIKLPVTIPQKELIQLLKGQKVTCIFFGDYEITLIPENHGVLLTYKEYDLIKKACVLRDYEIFDEIEKRHTKKQLED